MNNTQLSYKSAPGLRRKYSPSKPKRPSLDLILKCCVTDDVTANQIISYGRKQEVNWQRHIFCTLAYDYAKESTTEIGLFIGGKDHATVLHSNKTMKSFLENDKVIPALYYRAKEKLMSLFGELPPLTNRDKNNPTRRNKGK
jgi:chromosomal replication initiation ATPase DnaA